MIKINTKYDEVKIFTDNVEQQAVGDIIEMANSPLGENAHIRIMPDCHAGKGCTIGTTMLITDKVCPNIVGVDVACGVTLTQMPIKFEDNLEKLDKIIREHIPYGNNSHKNKFNNFKFEEMKCWNKLAPNTQKLAKLSMGTLGGGNHFIEAYKDGYISVHSGSRNIGAMTAAYYQKLAETQLNNYLVNERKEQLAKIPNNKKEQWLKEHKINYSKDLAYLTGQDKDDYLYDMMLLQEFANLNRISMLTTIANKFNVPLLKIINSTHNYIDIKTNILRKGAISAERGELLVMPLNMRDGLLVCKGKGNKDWNYSAPHGAGRIYSRSQAKKKINLKDYQESMEGIFSTCINNNTIDESPFVYKNYLEIMNNVEPTVEILKRLLPIFNFKAN